MFGNLIRECGVLDSLSETAQKVLANLITILLGLTIAGQMQAEQFLQPRYAADPGPGSGGLHLRHRRRRAVCQVPQPLPAKEKDQPHDRRGGHLGLPHVAAASCTRWG